MELPEVAREEQCAGKGAAPVDTDAVDPFVGVGIVEQNNFLADAEPFNEWFYPRIELVGHVETHQNQPEFAVLFVGGELKQVGHLLDAWQTPCGPEIDHVNRVAFGLQHRGELFE